MHFRNKVGRAVSVVCLIDVGANAGTAADDLFSNG